MMLTFAEVVLSVSPVTVGALLPTPIVEPEETSVADGTVS
jgi:hypothetical protein